MTLRASARQVLSAPTQKIFETAPEVLVVCQLFKIATLTPHRKKSQQRPSASQHTATAHPNRKTAHSVCWQTIAKRDTYAVLHHQRLRREGKNGRPGEFT